MSKPFLIIQLRPEDETSDSEYEAILRYGGLGIEQTRRLRIETTGIPALDIDDYAAIIVGGSPFDISTPPAEKSDIQLRIEEDFRILLSEVVPRDKPFLGACSGCGLLGSYLGTTISRRFAEPVGGVSVAVTEAGRADPLLRGLPASFAALCGHKEACDATPAGSTLLVTGEACPVQMFRVGENVYATQFHPEGDAEGFAVRIETYKHHGYFEPHQAAALIESVNGQDTPHARTILRRFVERYAA